MNAVSYTKLLFPIVPKNLLIYGASGCGKTNVLNSVVMGLTKEVDFNDIKILYVDAKGMNSALKNVKCPCIEYVGLCGEETDNEKLEHVMSSLENWSFHEIGHHSLRVVMLSDVHANKHLSEKFLEIVDIVESNANMSLVIDNPCGIEDANDYAFLNESSSKLIGTCSEQVSNKLLGE